MRLPLLAPAALALMASAVFAAAPTPDIPKGAPYPLARVQLIERGFEPVPVAVKSEEYVCRYYVGLCRRYPELVTCTAMGAQFCNYLFRRRSDGAYFVVTVFGEYVSETRLGKLTVHNVHAASAEDFRDIVIAKPALQGLGRNR